MPIDHEVPIRVGIGLIERGGSYLIRRRPPGSAMAGYWEFPGGKCEPGESPERRPPGSAWRRSGSGWWSAISSAGSSTVILTGWLSCTTFGVRSKGLSIAGGGSGFVWVAAGDLPGYRFPEANDAVIAALAREGVGTRGSLRDEP